MYCSAKWNTEGIIDDKGGKNTKILVDIICEWSSREWTADCSGLSIWTRPMDGCLPTELKVGIYLGGCTIRPKCEVRIIDRSWRSSKATIGGKRGFRCLRIPPDGDNRGPEYRGQWWAWRRGCRVENQDILPENQDLLPFQILMLNWREMLDSQMYCKLELDVKQEIQFYVCFH